MTSMMQWAALLPHRTVSAPPVERALMKKLAMEASV